MRLYVVIGNWGQCVLFVELLEAGASGLALPMERRDELGKYRGRGNAVFVAEVGAEHEPDGLFVAEWHLVSLLHESERRVANVFEACAR